MGDYIDRMNVELKELEEKYKKLVKAFYGEKSGKFDYVEKYLIMKQDRSMMDYITVLTARIRYEELKVKTADSKGFKPTKKGEGYWCFENGNEVKRIFGDTPTDKLNIGMGNAFRTRELARKFKKGVLGNVSA